VKPRLWMGILKCLVNLRTEMVGFVLMDQVPVL